MADLVTSTCLACGQHDDHPKHQVLVDENHTSVWFHMDCHARSSEACDVCTMSISGAPEGAKGDTLRVHLLSPANLVLGV